MQLILQLRSESVDSLYVWMARTWQYERKPGKLCYNDSCKALWVRKLCTQVFCNHQLRPSKLLASIAEVPNWNLSNLPVCSSSSSSSFFFFLLQTGYLNTTVSDFSMNGQQFLVRRSTVSENLHNFSGSHQVKNKVLQQLPFSWTPF